MCLQANLTKGPLLEAEQWGEWAGCDAAISVEVVEHVRDTDAYAKSLLGCLRCAPLLACLLASVSMQASSLRARLEPDRKPARLPVPRPARLPAVRVFACACAVQARSNSLRAVVCLPACG